MKKIVALLVLFCTVATFAQNGRLDGEVFSRSGFPLPGATVAVCSQIAITAATFIDTLCSHSIVNLGVFKRNPSPNTVPVAWEVCEA